MYRTLFLGTLGLLATATAASAQYRPLTSGPGIAEDYHIEASYNWWNAQPTLIVSSESLGILGSDVDLISDLGIEKHRLGKFDLVLKPGKKHRLKYQRLPIRYSTDAFPVQREFVFNGQRYRVGLPVTTNVDFTTDTFGYEYDFIHMPRGFIGAGINVMLTNIDVSLQSPIGEEFFEQTAPIPAFSFAGRGYVTPNLSIDAELKFFRIPESIERQIEGDGSYTDFDIHGTYNFNKYVGAQLGWRKTAIFYTAENDTGDLKFKGIYFGGVVRY
ncbi:MAG TPA: hypothetical protein VEA16_20960 [Vicinamibacterales bacterium]|nr:hypothetical protein [Vicinamibacterales bacterium]